MNKNSTNSGDYRPRAMRMKENKTNFKIFLAAVTILLVACGILYSIYSGQSGSDQKLTSAGNAPARNKTAENVQSSNDEQAGSKQTGSLAASEISPDQDKPSSQDARPEASIEADKENTKHPVVAEASGADQENNSVKAPAPTGQAGKLPTTYVVQKGDTLSTISMKFYNSKQHVDLLAAQNNIVFINDMNVGDTIKIPALSVEKESTPKNEQDNLDYSKVTLPVTYLVRSGDTLYHISMLFYHSQDYVDLIAEQNKLEKTVRLKAGTSLIIPAIPDQAGDGKNSKAAAVTEHTVLQGETLSSISRKYYNSSKYANTIANYNHLADNDDVKTGLVLKIPPLPKR